MTDFNNSAARMLVQGETDSAPRAGRRRVLRVQHDIPDATKMLSDAYAIVGVQLGRMRNKASFSEFGPSEANTLLKLVSALKMLDETEKAKVKDLQLNAISKESLELLAAQASEWNSQGEV